MLLTLVSCERISILTTPKKTAKILNTPLSDKAESNFWEALHKGDYQHIPEAVKLLTAAYLANPNNPRLAAHLGFLHIWKLTERARVPANDPTIVDEIILAKKYFADAVELDPGDARYLGFLGDAVVIEGKIFNNARESVRGYFILKQAIDQWPEFNYFTAGFPLSSLSPEDHSYKEALAWQWDTMDLCAGTTVDRANPDFSPYMHRETQTGPQRVCWNSWIAPHNFEGFFLNMGDMLVKEGNWQTAIKIYQNAKLSKNYDTWPYRTFLENRIKNAQNNTKNFQQLGTTPDQRILLNSGYGCVVCHQAR